MGHCPKPSASVYWHLRHTNHQIPRAPYRTCATRRASSPQPEQHTHAVAASRARLVDSHPGRVPDDQVGDANGEDDVNDMGSSYGAARPCHPCYTVLDGPGTEARMAALRSSASSGCGTRTKNPAVTLKPPGLKGCTVGAWRALERPVDDPGGRELLRIPGAGWRTGH
jgi:hypothetical protein